MSKSDWEEMIPNHRERVLPWEREQIPTRKGSLEEQLKAHQVMRGLLEQGRWWYTSMAPVRLIKAHPWKFIFALSSLVYASFSWHVYQTVKYQDALRDFSQQNSKILDICVEESQRACDVFIGAKVFYDCSAEVYQTCEPLMELASQLGSEKWQADRYLWEREDAFGKQVTSMTSILTQHLDNLERMSGLLVNPTLQGLDILPPYTDQKVTQVQAILEQHERNEPVVDDLQHRLGELYFTDIKHHQDTLLTDEVLEQVQRVTERVQPVKMEYFGESLLIEQQIRDVGEHLEISVDEPDLSVFEDDLFSMVLRGEMNVLIGHSSLAFKGRYWYSTYDLIRFPIVSNPLFSKLDLESQIEILNTIDGEVSEQSVGVWDKWIRSDSTASPIDLDQVLASTELAMPWYTGRGSEYQCHLSEQERLALLGQKKLYQGDIEASVSLFESISKQDTIPIDYISQRVSYSEVYQQSDPVFLVRYSRRHFTDSTYGLRGYLRLIEADLNVECKKLSDKCRQVLSRISNLSLMSNLPENAFSKIDQHLIRLIEAEKVSPSLSTVDLCDLPTDWLERHPHKPYRDWLSFSIQDRLENEQDALTPSQFRQCQERLIDLEPDLEWSDDQWSLLLKRAVGVTEGYETTDSIGRVRWDFHPLIQMGLNQNSDDRFEDIYQALMSIEPHEVRGNALRGVLEMSVPKDEPVEWIAFRDKVFVSYKEFLSGIDTVSDRAEHQIKLLRWMNDNDVGNVKEYLETTLETIATIEDIHVRVAKQLKVVQWMRETEDCISCDREVVASEHRVQRLNTVANWLNNQTASDVAWEYKSLAIAFANEERFDQAIKMKDKAWFTNTIAETSVEVAKRLHQHDPTDWRIQSLVSDAIQRVNDANWTGDFGTAHVDEYIKIIRPLQDMDWAHATLEDLRQRAVDVIDNIPGRNSQLHGVRLLLNAFEDQPVSSTIWSALLDKAYRVLASNDSFDNWRVEQLWSAIPLGLQYQYAHLLLPEMLRILEPKRWTSSKVKRLRSQLQNHPYWYRVVDSPETDEIKMSSQELWNYDYTHLPTVESATHSRYRWVLDAPEIPLELSDKSLALLKQGGLNPPPRCIRDSVVVGYTQSTLTHFEDVLPRWVTGQELRGRARGIQVEPTGDIKKWYGQVTTESSEDPCFVAFPFPLLTTDELTALDAELTQYESDFAAMKALRKRAKGLQVDTTKWQPPYDVASYTKQVELAERLIEEMSGLIPKAKTLHVDLTQTTINDVPVLQQPYQESVVQQLGAELTRIEGFIAEWNTARTEAIQVGYTFPRALPVDKMTQEVLNWHTRYISQTPTVRKLMRQFKMVTIPKGEFLYLDFDEPFVVDHSFKMGRTELTEELYCVAMGLEESGDRKCRKNYPVALKLSQAETLFDVLSFQMGTSCDESFERCTNRYRIPTLTEWRYAASAKQNYYYAGSHNPYDVAWIDEGVMPIGVKEPNAWGLYDMSGNRSEWVDTLGRQDYQYQAAGESSVRSITNHYWHDNSGVEGVRLVYDTQSTNTVSWNQE